MKKLIPIAVVGLLTGILASAAIAGPEGGLSVGAPFTIDTPTGKATMQCETENLVTEIWTYEGQAEIRPKDEVAKAFPPSLFAVSETANVREFTVPALANERASRVFVVTDEGANPLFAAACGEDEDLLRLADRNDHEIGEGSVEPTDWEQAG